MVQKIVVCLTTIPSRMKFLTAPLSSMKVQTRIPDKVFLFIPEYSKKENIPYQEIKFGTKNNIFTNEKAHYQFEWEKIEIVRCKDDYGPITKLYPITEMSKKDMGFDEDDEILVINIDDDRNYFPTTIESLVTAYNSGIGCCSVSIAGWIYGTGMEGWIKLNSPSDPVIIDWPEASYGVLYNYSQIEMIKEKLLDFSVLPEAKYCDDMWIACWLKEKALFPYIYAVNLINHNFTNDTFQENQISTKAKYVKALHCDFKECKDEEKKSNIINILNTTQRYSRVINGLKDLNPHFLNAESVGKVVNGKKNYTTKVILSIFLAVIFVGLIIFLIVNGVKWYIYIHNLRKGDPRYGKYTHHTDLSFLYN